VGIGATPQPAAGTHDRITVRINSNDQKYQIDRPCQVADGKTTLSHRESGPSGLARIVGVQIHFLGVWIQSLFWVSGFSPFSGCLDSVPFLGVWIQSLFLGVWIQSLSPFSGCLDSVPFLGVWIQSLFWVSGFSPFFWVSGFSPSVPFLGVWIQSLFLGVWIQSLR
jgi:hypothetical protein